jgi:hypothetical protein
LTQSILGFDAPAAKPATGDSSWSRAVTGVPEEAWRTTKEHAGSLWENVKGAFPQIEELSTGKTNPPESVWNVPKRLGNFASAVGEVPMLPLAPFIGAGKSLLGRPLAHAVQKTGETIAPEGPGGPKPYQDILGRTVTPPRPGSAEDVYEQIRPDVETGLMSTMPREPALGARPWSPELPPTISEKAPPNIQANVSARANEVAKNYDATLRQFTAIRKT